MTTLKFWLFGFLICGLACGDVASVSVEEAAAKLKKDPKIVVVDLRTPEEFAKGHIKGAINVNKNSEDFAKKLAKLDRKKTYLMHCLSGGRSASSLPVWKKLKFEKVLHLETGYLDWIREGQPTVVPKKK